MHIRKDAIEALSTTADNGRPQANQSAFRKMRRLGKKGTTRISQFFSYSWRIFRPTCLTRMCRTVPFQSEEEVNMAEILGITEQEFLQRLQNQNMQRQDAENDNQPVEAEQEDAAQQQRIPRPDIGRGAVIQHQQQRGNFANFLAPKSLLPEREN